MFNKLRVSSGKVSTVLLVLAAMLIVLIIAVFIFLRISAVRNSTTQTVPDGDGPVEPEKPVYETTLGDVRFVFESADDLGSVLVSPVAYQKNLTTTERFIKVVIGAQNKGKINLEQGSWDVENIVDSEGRNFVSINNQAYAFLPAQNLCGVLLKPEFQPTPCLKLYEVSKESKGLKIKVVAAVPGFSKGKDALIDLLVK